MKFVKCLYKSLLTFHHWDCKFSSGEKIREINWCRINFTKSFTTMWKSRQKHDHCFCGKFKTFSVKSTFLLKKLVKSWFHGNFWAWSRFIVFFHTVSFHCWSHGFFTLYAWLHELFFRQKREHLRRKGSYEVLQKGSMWLYGRRMSGLSFSMSEMSFKQMRTWMQTKQKMDVWLCGTRWHSRNFKRKPLLQRISKNTSRPKETINWVNFVKLTKHLNISRVLITK